MEPLESTVDAWLGATRDVVLDERERGKALDAKTAQLTGFIGVILALDVTLAHATLTQRLTAPYSHILPMPPAMLKMTILKRSERENAPHGGRS